jgi:hypothetical protein
MGVSESVRLLCTGAFGFGVVLAALVSTFLSKSEWGEGVAASAAELKKLTPAYWRAVARADSAFGVRQPTLIGRSQPVWTPDFLPSGSRPSRRRGQPARAPQPLLQAPTYVASSASSAPSAVDYPDLLIHEESSEDNARHENELAGFWSGSPSPLGRVGV